MKTFHPLRQQQRARHLAVIRPTRIEVNRTNLREALYSRVQTKLRIGSTDDHLEHEADSIADRVLAMGDGPIQGKPLDSVSLDEEERQQPGAENEQEEEVRRKAVVSTTAISADGNALAPSRGGGHPLPGSERAFFEPRLGTDLSRVRVHSDDEAARLAAGLSARAFTTGGEIYFGAGEYRPGSQEGRRLLAHELTHVLQQGQGKEVLQRKIDKLTVSKEGVKVNFSLGIYGPRATTTLAATWKKNIEDHWSIKLKFDGSEVDTKVVAKVQAYPQLPDCDLSQAVIPESNAVFVETAVKTSHVKYSCPLREHRSCGRWRVDAPPLVVAHETGHMIGLKDRYKKTSTGVKEEKGYEKDIMANFKNDNGDTDFTRAWYAVLVYYFTGWRG